MKIDIEGSICAEEAARLLPWYVAGRLAPPDAERVARHLEHCAICRDDLAHERGVRALLKSDNVLEYGPQAGLARTLARIDELGREAPTALAAPTAPTAAVARLRPRRFAPVKWLTAAVVVQAIGLGVLGAELWQRSNDAAAGPRYETLSSSPTLLGGGPRIRAVFAPAMTLAELKTLLGSRGLTIVHGPTDAGAYTLAARDASNVHGTLDPTITALRTDGRVLFVEPAVDGGVATK